MPDQGDRKLPHKREGDVGQGQPSPSDQTSRRHFLKSTATGLLVGALAGSRRAFGLEGKATAGRASFQSRWPSSVERYWVGPEYWANPLSEWRISGGRLEFVAAEEERNVQHLTRQLGEQKGTLDLRVLTGFSGAGRGQAGFEVGIQGPLGGYRNNAVRGSGLKVGLASDGRLFIGDVRGRLSRSVSAEGVALHLTAAPSGKTYALALSALDVATGEELGRLRRRAMPAEQLVGNLALFADVEDEADTQQTWGDPRIWFRDWAGSGTKLVAHDEHAFGPILFSQHTLSRGVMKMTAQLPPVGDEDDQTVRLQIERNGRWTTIAEEPIHKLARTATFRVEGWSASRDVPYRLAYRYRTADGLEPHYYEGTVRRDPVDQEDIVVGVLSCAIDAAFPNKEIVRGLRYHDPDVLASTGDQYYEHTGGYVRRAQDNMPLATLDALHRWYMHGWSFGDLMRDRPTLCLLDDHDVFQPNIWGEGGKQVDRMKLHNNGGYFMPAEWVNMVQRIQTAHLPDPYDPAPIRNGITVYYTDMCYGRISFALLEDRKWKSGPDGLVPPNPGLPDWIEDPNFDPETVDMPGAKLLGERQLDFLETWAADWRGADMKVVVSQTSFAQVPTHHGPKFRYLVADLDSNSWPQTPRDEALRRFRKGFAFHIGGDQHLPMFVRYGIDEWNDAPYNFCVPGVAVGYPRAFWPEHSGYNHQEGMPYYTGQYRDGLANKMTVYAVGNPEKAYRTEHPLQELADKSSGYGIVRFNKEMRQITAEAWPILSDPRKGDSEQYVGWPRTVAMQNNYARKAQAYLPALTFSGVIHPMVQVVDEASGEVVYTLRIEGREFRPKVFQEGTYTIRIGDDEEWRKKIEGVRSEKEAHGSVLEVTL